MLTATLLTKAKEWKQPKFPIADEQIHKMWFVGITEQFWQ
jgi:hypothetical protein